MALLLAIARSAAADTAVLNVTFQVTHAADGKKYPTPVIETYEVHADGSVHYAAYFQNMPTNLNHQDSADWASSAPGRAVIAAARRSARTLHDPEHDKFPTATAKEGVYWATVTRGDHDVALFAAQNDTPAAFKAIRRPFRALIAAFEKATGRPLSSTTLPQ